MGSVCWLSGGCHLSGLLHLCALGSFLSIFNDIISQALMWSQKLKHEETIYTTQQAIYS